MAKLPGWSLMLVGALVAAYSKFIETKTGGLIAMFFWVGIAIFAFGALREVRTRWKKKTPKERAQPPRPTQPPAPHIQRSPHETHGHVQPHAHPSHPHQPQYKRCPRCHRLNYPSANFCHHCGFGF